MNWKNFRKGAFEVAKKTAIGAAAGGLFAAAVIATGGAMASILVPIALGAVAGATIGSADALANRVADRELLSIGCTELRNSDLRSTDTGKVTVGIPTVLAGLACAAFASQPLEQQTPDVKANAVPVETSSFNVPSLQNHFKNEDTRSVKTVAVFKPRTSTALTQG